MLAILRRVPSETRLERKSPVSRPEIGLHICKLKSDKMERKLFRPHYAREFKRKVVEEYLATGCTKMFLLRKYNIQFKSAIQTWIRTLGYDDPGSQGQRFKFGQIIFTSLAREKQNTTEPTELQKRILELERQLEDEKLRSEAYARMIEKAEKELKISIRKKTDTK